jgi:hypothetical protein
LILPLLTDIWSMYNKPLRPLLSTSLPNDQPINTEPLTLKQTAQLHAMPAKSVAKKKGYKPANV